jgi:hypothetical protein
VYFCRTAVSEILFSSCERLSFLAVFCQFSTSKCFFRNVILWIVLRAIQPNCHILLAFALVVSIFHFHILVNQSCMV